MKKFFLVLSFLAMKGLVGTANAQIYISGENQVGFNNKDGTAPSFIYSSNYYIQQNRKDSTKLKLAGYIYFTKNYLEAIPLLTYVVNKKVRISGGVGFETQKPYWRTMARAIFWDSLNIAKAIFEIGGGSDNYRYVLSYDRIMGPFIVGAISQRYLGTGFRFGVIFSKHLVVQIGPLLRSSPKEMNALLFVRYSF